MLIQPIDRPSARLIRTEQRQYHSRYFDYQKAYRYLVHLNDGNTVETTVYYHYLNNHPTTMAVDVSTMVGCPLACKFCSAGTKKYIRSLTADEIYFQFKSVLSQHDQTNFPKLLCSYQGIGETSLTPYEVIDSAAKINSSYPSTKFSISTIAENADAITIWGKSNLAIDSLQFSCSSLDPIIAKSLYPKYNINNNILKQIAICSEYKNIKKVKINYILIKNTNDSANDLNLLIKNFSTLEAIVKISVLNYTVTSNKFDFSPSDFATANLFCEELRKSNIDSYVYGDFSGNTISCGQLVEGTINNE